MDGGALPDTPEAAEGFAAAAQQGGRGRQVTSKVLYGWPPGSSS
jgi:hypothetical protein